MSSSLPTITLQQFAGIRSALAEGFPLEEVLAQEGVPDWRWPELERELTVQVTSTPEHFAAFAADLERAEDQLGRNVAPLDDDLAAWTGFITAYRAGGQSLLDAHGLRATDIGRIQRNWQRRFEDDHDLRAQAERARQHPPPPPTRIEAAASVLRPFDWTPPEREAAQRGSLEPLHFLARTEAAKPPLKTASSAPPLPFSGERPPPMRAPLEPSPHMGSTAGIDNRRREAATPFEPAPEPPSMAHPPAVAPAPVAAPLRGLPPSSPTPPRRSLEPVAELSGTARVEPRPQPQSALPFGDEAAKPTPIHVDYSPHGGAAPLDARAGGGLEPLAHLATTAPLGPTAPSASVTPFAGQKPLPAGAARSLEPVAGLGQTKADPTAAWTVEDYGRYCAELETRGRVGTFARWHVRDDAHHNAIVAIWLQRFAQDNGLRKRFVAALQAAAASLHPAG